MKCVLQVYEGYNHIFMLLVEHVEGSLDGLCMCMTYKPYNVPVFSYNYMPSLYISWSIYIVVKETLYQPVHIKY